jgi:DNA-binding FadR family transcriptional regulator
VQEPLVPGNENRKADRVAKEILRRVIHGDFPIGSVLPKEADLAASFAVNRGVVREAMKLLEMQGIVRPVRRRGTLVMDPLASLSPDVLRALMQPEPGRIDIAFFQGVLAMRELLDVEMAGLAARHRTRADVTAIERQFAAVQGTLAEPARFQEEAYRLALTIARATKNPLYQMLVHWNQAVVRDLDHVFATIRAATGPWISGMEMFVRAIADGDEPAARQLVASFHAWASPRLLATARLANGDPIDTIHT